MKFIPKKVAERFRSTVPVKPQSGPPTKNPNLVRTLKVTKEGYSQHFWIARDKAIETVRKKSRDIVSKYHSMKDKLNPKELKRRLSDASASLLDSMLSEINGRYVDTHMDTVPRIDILEAMSLEPVNFKQKLARFEVPKESFEHAVHVPGQDEHDIKVYSPTSRKRGVNVLDVTFEHTDVSNKTVTVDGEQIDVSKDQQIDIVGKTVKLDGKKLEKGEDLFIEKGTRLDVNGNKYDMIDGKKLTVDGKEIDYENLERKRVGKEMMRVIDVDGKKVSLNGKPIEIKAKQLKIRDTRRLRIDKNYHETKVKNEQVMVYHHSEDGKQYEETLFELHKRWKAGGASDTIVEAYTYKLLEMIHAFSRNKQSLAPRLVSGDAKTDKDLERREKLRKSIPDMHEFTFPDMIVIPPITFTKKNEISDEDRQSGIVSDEERFGTPENKANQSLHHRVAKRISELTGYALDKDTGKHIPFEEVMQRYTNGEENSMELKKVPYSPTALGTKSKQIKTLTGGKNTFIVNRGPTAEDIFVKSGIQENIATIAKQIPKNGHVWVIDDNVDTGSTHWALSKLFKEHGITTDNVSLFDMRGITASDRKAIQKIKAEEGTSQFKDRIRK